MRSKRITARRKGTIPWTPAERWVQRSVIGFVALLAVLTGWVSFRDESERTVAAAGSDIRLPLKELRPGNLRLVTYATRPSTTIPVAIQQGDDKILRVAFGSCRSCRHFSHYAWSGTLVCGRCRHVMRMPDPGSGTEVKRTGCALAPLSYSIAEGQLVVLHGTIATEFSRQFTTPKQAGSN